jgi:hypothetical protein
MTMASQPLSSKVRSITQYILACRQENLRPSLSDKMWGPGVLVGNGDPGVQGQLRYHREGRFEKIAVRTLVKAARGKKGKPTAVLQRY